MNVTTTPIDGTEMIALTAIIKSGQERAVRRCLFELEQTPGDEWTPMSREAARSKYGNTWDAPAWKSSNADRLAWVRDHTNAKTWAGIEFIRAQGMVSGDAVAAAAGYADGMAWKSVLPHLAGYCLRVGRRPLWDVRKVDGVWHYYLPEIVTALLTELDEQ